MDKEGKINRTKFVVAIEYSKNIHLQLYIFNKHFRWALLRHGCCEMGSMNCRITSNNRHCYCGLAFRSKYNFFFLQKKLKLFHSNKIKPRVQQLKLQLANIYFMVE